MKINPAIFGLFIALSIVLGASVGEVESRACREKIQQLQVRCAFLNDYKNAFLDLADKCDTCHVHCYQMPKSLRK